MALLDLFKKKKRIELSKKDRLASPACGQFSAEKPKPVRKPKTEKKEVPIAIQPQAPAKQSAKAKAMGAELAFRVLKSPHVTEKAGDLAAQNQYTFKIFPEANKIQVKQAVEGVYGVAVEHVRIIRVLGKKRRSRKSQGWRPGYKKAIVKLKAGHTIEVLPR